MRTIPISAIPNQSFSVRQDDQRFVLRLKEANGVMVADVERDGVEILRGSRVLAGELIIPYPYLQSGNFMVLTINDELPDWRQFGVSQTLVYLSAEEIATPPPLPAAVAQRMTWNVPPVLYGQNTAAGRVLGDRRRGFAIDFVANSVVYRSGSNRVDRPDYSGTIGDYATFARASIGTYWGSDGLLKTAAAGVPRFNHTAGAGDPVGLLIEPSRQNLLLQSQNFGTTWTSAGLTLTTGGTAPDGTTTATKLVKNVGTNTAGVIQGSIPVVNGAVYTASCFFRAAEVTQADIYFPADRLGAINRVIFDLVAGTVVSTAGDVRGLVEDRGNGWVRCEAVLPPTTSGGNQQMRIYPAVGGAINTPGDGVSGLFAWGAQLELGGSPSSYIPTTTTRLTRAADAFSFTLPAGTWTITYTFADGTTQGDGATGGVYTIPTSLDRRNIRTLLAVPA